jgi:hypothetical protein
MDTGRFQFDRYDPTPLVEAFDVAELVTKGTEVYHLLECWGDELEIQYPDFDAPPVDAATLALARQFCNDVRTVDNLVQRSFAIEAQASDLHIRNFLLHIGYVDVYSDRVHVKYWGIVVNTEWEARLSWSESTGWKPLNFSADGVNG